MVLDEALAPRGGHSIEKFCKLKHNIGNVNLTNDSVLCCKVCFQDSMILPPHFQRAQTMWKRMTFLTNSNPPRQLLIVKSGLGVFIAGEKAKSELVYFTLQFLGEAIYLMWITSWSVQPKRCGS
ncbi:hypothetical protein L6452_01392 [Arctium lappa]|uniref:Uncharacterized protein n=1 Tax=Arctium lappa TaxID=4217 RepID=A0ACB9FGJ6_ARCLA|nr:hypothetical protein L6452_01392 [Arctium lappa]